MFDFSNTKESTPVEEYEVEKKVDLDMNLLLEKIDTAQYEYFETLSDNEKKSFQPYVIQRWISSLDDSMQVTYSAKSVEAIFGKWAKGGKDALNELRTEFINNGIECIGVAKYQHAQYDWRIKFAVKNKAAAEKLIQAMQEFSITGYEIVSLVDSTTYKHLLIMLNDMVNEGMWEMQNTPDLVYQLLCSVSSIVGGRKQAHTWLPFPKGLKNVNKNLFGLIKKTQPMLTAAQLSEVEYKILLLGYDKKSFEALLEDFGFQDSDKKDYLKQFKAECEKYGKTS
ncbi:hypothetical protein BZF66_04735 [Salmonella enterica]|nr:hypothetical protein CPT_Munch_310 [Salmonella phage Munch]EAZ2022605.1 hypothetical protein [Salmonella enterica]MCP0435670.1 hypothetical protein [Salmonella enterica subsp. enterica serovar Mbandaka]ECC6867561.1 hypothetical protein [Salmonella enterica]EHX8550546.1 hypothetical protein [Salmonella enterica]